jgi:hypothetical protein
MCGRNESKQAIAEQKDHAQMERLSKQVLQTIKSEKIITNANHERSHWKVQVDDMRLALFCNNH